MRQVSPRSGPFGKNRYRGNSIEGSPIGTPSEESLLLRRMFYAYILQSKKDLRYYYGSTTDLIKRMKYHNSGKVK